MARKRIPIRYGTLLILILLMHLLVPWLEGTFFRGYALLVLFALVQVAAVNTVVGKPRTFRIAIALLVLSQGLLWFAVFDGSPAAKAVSYAGWIVFDAYVIAILLLHLVRSKEVDADTVIGGICIYLLIGFAWIGVYMLVETLQPGSFRGMSGASKWPDFFFFSFVTLTTLGYGDIVPLTTKARSLATLEAIFGVLYLAVLISRLVGMAVTQSQHRRRSED